MKTSILIIISCLGFLSKAQSSDPSIYAWWDAHLGAGNVFHANASANINYDQLVFSYQIDDSSRGGIFSREGKTLTGHSIMAGYMRKGGISYICVQSGLSLLKYKHTFQTGVENWIFFNSPTYDTETSRLIGVPLVVKGGISAKVISVQMTVGANLNAEMSTLYLGLGLGLGKLF